MTDPYSLPDTPSEPAPAADAPASPTPAEPAPSLHGVVMLAARTHGAEHTSAPKSDDVPPLDTRSGDVLRPYMPGSVELHLSTSTEFTQRGWHKRVEKLGGTWSDVRGHAMKRFVELPLSSSRWDDVVEMVDQLLAAFPYSPKLGTVLLFRGLHVSASRTGAPDQFNVTPSDVATPRVLERFCARYIDALLAPAGQKYIRERERAAWVEARDKREAPLRRLVRALRDTLAAYDAIEGHSAAMRQTDDVGSIRVALTNAEAAFKSAHGRDCPVTHTWASIASETRRGQ